MNQKPLAISVSQLHRCFKDKIAVNHLDLSVKEGEIYSFLGPNGAGKSTTIKMLVTLLDPSSGDIEIFGLNTKKQADKARLIIGVALQEASLDESQTGEEFLKIQGAIYGLGKEAVAYRIEELKPLIDIGAALQKQIKTYSGGMKRRLDLAASIIHKPKILFLDEPTTGLDPISRNKVWKEIRKLNKEEGVTIFLTTQYLEEADQLADRVGIINEGKLVAEGTVEELKNNIGDDLIIAKIESISKETIDQLKKINGVSNVEEYEGEVTITSQNGSRVIGDVAITLNKGNTETFQISV